jgi:hypothetical protein
LTSMLSMRPVFPASTSDTRPRAGAKLHASVRLHKVRGTIGKPPNPFNPSPFHNIRPIVNPPPL